MSLFRLVTVKNIVIPKIASSHVQCMRSRRCARNKDFQKSLQQWLSTFHTKVAEIFKSIDICASIASSCSGSCFGCHHVQTAGILYQMTRTTNSVTVT